MINIKDFDSSLIKIDKKSYKNIGFTRVNPLYLMTGEVDRKICKALG